MNDFDKLLLTALSLPVWLGLIWLSMLIMGAFGAVLSWWL